MGSSRLGGVVAKLQALVDIRGAISNRASARLIHPVATNVQAPQHLGCGRLRDARTIRRMAMSTFLANVVLFHDAAFQEIIHIEPFEMEVLSFKLMDEFTFRLVGHGEISSLIVMRVAAKTCLIRSSSFASASGLRSIKTNPPFRRWNRKPKSFGAQMPPSGHL